MKTKVTIFLMVATLILGFMSVTSVLAEDRKAPEITVPQSDMVYYELDDQSTLLAGVTATDNRDGDISSQVRIYDVAVIDGNQRALVTYAVYDSSYNLGKATKVVSYVPGQKGPNTSDSDVSLDAGIVDMVEEATEATTEETTEATTEEPGFEDPVMESDGDPVIKLITHYETIDVGGYFYSMDYVDDIVDDEDDTDYLYANTYMDGYYDTEVEGEYELTFYCVDSDGNMSNKAKLILTVGDGDNE